MNLLCLIVIFFVAEEAPEEEANGGFRPPNRGTIPNAEAKLAHQLSIFLKITLA